MKNNDQQKPLLVNRSVIVRLLIFAVFIVAAYYIGSKYLSLEQIQSKSVALKQTVEQNYIHSVIIFIAIFAFVISLALPVMIPLSLVSGFVFGVVPGAIYATIASTIGCVVSFLIFRYFLGSALRKRYNGRLDAFKARMDQYGPSYILFLHYSAVFPLFVINSCAALTNISLPMFTAMSILGLVPLNLIYALAGRELSTIHSFGDIFSPLVIISLVLLMVLALMPMIIRRFKGSMQD